MIQLVKYVQKSVKEKNWSKLLSLVMDLMATAEEEFETGAERKEWVMKMVKTSANKINYDIDVDALSEMIDSLCAMSKQVNAEEASPEVVTKE